MASTRGKKAIEKERERRKKERRVFITGTARGRKQLKEREEEQKKAEPVKKKVTVREPIVLGKPPEPEKEPGFFAPLQKKFPEERIAAEPLPIGPAGAVGIAKTLYKGVDVTKIVAKERGLQTIMRQFKISRGAAESIAKTVATSTPQKILKILTSKPAKLWTAGVLTGSGIVAWLASDNVLTGTTFTMRKLRDSVVDETTREEALEEAEEVQAWIDTATTFVNVATRINPLLWPFRTIFMLNARKAQVDFDLEVMLIKTKLTAAEEAEQFWRESAAAKERVGGEEPVIEEPAEEGRPPIEL